MTSVLSVLGPFGDAFEFIVKPRESVTGGVQVGGPSEIADLTVQHMKLSLAAILIAALVALPIGLWLGHIRKGEFLAISASNVGRAVPTLALIAFFIAYLGIGFVNVLVALVLLAIPPILTTTYVGVTQVEPDTVDAARGMGMAERQIVGRVELPLALPTIFNGIQIAAVSVVATAILGPLASVNTLGTPIISANVYGESGRLGASIVVALISLLVAGGLTAVQRAVTPRGLKTGRNSQSFSSRLRDAVPFPRRGEQTA